MAPARERESTMEKWVLPVLILALCCCSAAAEETARYQWEDGTLAGQARVDQMGTRAWVVLNNPGEDSVTVTVEAPKDGLYDLTVCSAGVDGRKESQLLLDGMPVENTVAEGAQCAADVPVPAREVLVFGGADGTFDLYDDAGDGYEEGITIPLTYDDGKGALTSGPVCGRLPEPVEITVRIYRPDGTEKTQQLAL